MTLTEKNVLVQMVEAVLGDKEVSREYKIEMIKQLRDAGYITSDEAIDYVIDYTTPKTAENE